MTEKPAKKAPAKRKPRNTIVDAAPQIAELAKRMEAERARIIAEMAAEEEAKKKPVDDSPFELSDLSPGTIRELRKILDGEKTVIDQAIKEAEAHLVKPAASSSSPWRRFMLVGAVAAGLVVAFFGGVWSTGGWNIGPKPVVFTDSLAESHTNDRASQVRILREYAAKTFSSEPEAQEWLNKQRIAARPDDWGPYTNELGKKADEGPEAVKAFADALEGK